MDGVHLPLNGKDRRVPGRGLPWTWERILKGLQGIDDRLGFLPGEVNLECDFGLNH